MDFKDKKKKGCTEFRYIGKNSVSDSVHKNNIGVPNFGT